MGMLRRSHRRPHSAQVMRSSNPDCSTVAYVGGTQRYSHAVHAALYKAGRGTGLASRAGARAPACMQAASMALQM